MTNTLAAPALVLAAILLVIGATGVIVRRNLVFVLLAIEVMLNAVALAFIAAGARWGGQAEGQIMYLFILATAAADSAVALALILRLNMRYGRISTIELNSMRG